MLGLEHHRLDRIVGDDALLACHHVLDLAHQPRLETLAARRQGRGGTGQLQRGEVVVTLADAQRDGFAGVPFLLFGLLVGLLLPRGRRQQAGDLALDVDAGAPPESERRELIVHQVDAEFVGQRVEVHVARFDDGAAHVHDAAALVFGAAEAPAAEHEKAGVVDQRRGRSLAGVQCHHRHERLERRARRVSAAQRAVQQRLVGRFVQLAPRFLVDAVDEQVRIEGRLADERQHLAVARIERHQRATPVAEQLFDQRLQLDVDRHHQHVAGRGGVAAQAPHGAAVGAGLDLLEAGAAVQLRLVALFDAELADVFGAVVIGSVFGVVDLFLLGRVDAADVAQQVAANLAERVVAKQPRLHLDPREAELLRRKTRHLFVAELGTDRQRLEILALVGHALEALAVARLDVHQLRQPVDHFVDIADPAGRDLQRVGRIVVGQHDAVAVDDDAAIRHDRQHRDAVAFGLRRQLVVAHHLQVDQPGTQQAEGEQHEGCRGKDPGAKAGELALDVLQLGHGLLNITTVDFDPDRAPAVAAPAATR